MKYMLAFESKTGDALISYVFGRGDVLFISLLLMMVLDYITGFCKAVVIKRLNSIRIFSGIAKKVGYLSLVALAVILDKILGSGDTIRNLIIYSFIVNEMLAILENCGAMGLKIPLPIYQILEQLQEQEQDPPKNNQKK